MYHDTWIHGNEIYAGHIFMNAYSGLVDQTTGIGTNEVQSCFGVFSLLFMPGHKDVLPHGGGHLHGGNTAAR